MFRRLDPEQFRACLQKFMRKFSQTCQGGVAIDGKVLRRSFDKASGKSPLPNLSAWGGEQRRAAHPYSGDDALLHCCQSSRGNYPDNATPLPPKSGFEKTAWRRRSSASVRMQMGAVAGVVGI